MSKQETTKWVCIARTGSFQDSEGREHTFTESDLETIRTAYNPAQSEAALCFGHPKDSAPAYGWVAALKRESGKLFAQFARVPAEVKKLVDDGRYRYVSMGLAPDKKRLLHVGLLGAAAPAIDGLGPISFNADEVTINFSLSEKEAANNGGNMTLEELQQKIGALTQQLNALQAEYDKLKGEKETAEKGKTDAEKLAAETAAEFSAFKGKIIADKRQERVRALVNSGKLEPAKEKETLEFAAALGEVKTPVNFSASDGKTEQISAEERFLRGLEATEPAPLTVNFAAYAGAPAHAAKPATSANYADVGKKL